MLRITYCGKIACGLHSGAHIVTLPSVSSLRYPARRARIGAVVAFATNGAIPATLLARYGEVNSTLDLDPAKFGLAVTGYALGAALALQLPAMTLRRFGGRLTTVVGTAFMALAFTLAATGAAAASVPIFVAGLMMAGLGDVVVDVAQNAQGLRVQAAYGRSVLTSMHAGWSVGAAIGGAVGTAAAWLGVPLVWHVGVWGIIATASMAWAARGFLPDPEAVPPAEGAPAHIGRRAMVLLIPLALVALAGITVEDIGNNWSAVLLSTERGLDPSAAGIGLSALLIGQFVGRLAGDRFVDKVGQRAALSTSLLTIALALTAAAWLPNAWSTIAALTIAGLGCAVTVPIAFAMADEIPGLKAHAGVTWVGWVIRVAGLCLSPAVGLIATLSSLPVAITVAAVPAAIALVLHLRGTTKP